MPIHVSSMKSKNQHFVGHPYFVGQGGVGHFIEFGWFNMSDMAYSDR